MFAPSFNDLPDVDSELFEHVTDDELVLLDYYRALRPGQRAALLEALVRMVEPSRPARSQTAPTRVSRARTRPVTEAVRSPLAALCERAKARDVRRATAMDATRYPDQQRAGP